MVKGHGKAENTWVYWVTGMLRTCNTRKCAMVNACNLLHLVEKGFIVVGVVEGKDFFSSVSCANVLLLCFFCLIVKMSWLLSGW